MDSSCYEGIKSKSFQIKLNKGETEHHTSQTEHTTQHPLNKLTMLLA